MNFTQEILPFHTGASMMSIMTSTPVVPVYINSSYKPFRKTYIHIGNPIKPTSLGNTKNATDEMTHLLEEKTAVLRDSCNSNISPKELTEIINSKEKHSKKIKQKTEVENDK